MLNTFFISTPIYYVNAKPHLGHAYTTIVADSINRFHKLQGKETYFLTGTDEHGDKIVQAAEKNKQTPKEYVDKISKLFKDTWPGLEIEYNRFIRTTDPDHIACVQSFLQRVYDNGDIYFGEYGGFYCFGCERFYTEKELQDGLCPDHQTKPEFIQEKNYFFRMSKYLKPLRDYIESHPDFIQPERYRNEVLGLLKEDLGDLCISRPKSRLTWGIELPFDKNFVTYVWFDALINYITALGWPDGEKFQKFWPNAHHLVAKDILKPHAIFWPTMLMAAGVDLYKGLRVHGYWTVNETKMSKSLGNVVSPMSMKDKYGLSAFRYFLLREMQFGLDASFSEEALVGRLNADLANDLGNLFSRVLTMTNKYFAGEVPEPGSLEKIDEEALELGFNALKNYQDLFPKFQFSKALSSLWELVRHLNKYIDTCAPWSLYKDKETERLKTVIYILLEGMRKIGLHLWPVMPSTSVKMLSQLGVDFDLQKVNLDQETKQWEGLKPGIKVAKKSNLFPRRELKLEESCEPKTEAQKDQKSHKEKNYIEFEDFVKVELKVGKVVKAQKVPKTDKLLQVFVDLGENVPRQVVAGLAEYYEPDELIGKQVVVVANLKPRKLRGVLSQGMILAVQAKGKMELLTVSGEVKPGSKVS
jgi:methionyl-tRNA synthetase